MLLMTLFWSLVLVSCQDKATPIASAPPASFRSSIGLETFHEFVRSKVALLPTIELDSIRIKQSTYHVYITDQQLTNLNKVTIAQNVGIILRDFCCFTIEDGPFKQVKVLYQLPLRDAKTKPLGYLTALHMNLTQLKQHLKLYSNLSFRGIAEVLVQSNKDFPEEQVLASLNTVLALVVSKEDDTKLEWFGVDVMNLITGYLVECEREEKAYHHKKLDRLLDFFVNRTKAGIKANRVLIAKRIKAAFEQHCLPATGSPPPPIREQIITI